MVFLAAVNYECETIIYSILFIRHLIVHKCFSLSISLLMVYIMYKALCVLNI